VSLHSYTPPLFRHWFAVALSWSGGWAQIVHFSAQILVLALSPSSYRRSQRGMLVRSIYRATRPSFASSWPLL